MALPIYHIQKHTADKEASITGQVVIYMVEVHANGANGDVELSDATTNGNDALMYSVLNGKNRLWDYTNLGGVVFNTGLSIDVAGAGCTVFIWTSDNQATA